MLESPVVHLGLSRGMVCSLFTHSKKGKLPSPDNPSLFLSIDSEGTVSLPFLTSERFNLDKIKKPRDFFRNRILACAPEAQCVPRDSL